MFQCSSSLLFAVFSFCSVPAAPGMLKCPHQSVVTAWSPACSSFWSEMADLSSYCAPALIFLGTSSGSSAQATTSSVQDVACSHLCLLENCQVSMVCGFLLLPLYWGSKLSRFFLCCLVSRSIQVYCSNFSLHIFEHWSSDNLVHWFVYKICIVCRSWANMLYHLLYGTCYSFCSLFNPIYDVC